MEEYVLKNYEKAKGVSDNVLPFAKTLVKKNVKILEIVEKIEDKIRKLDAKPAFPVNISINENAAHYTPDIDDTTTLKVGDLVKIDIGVQINGYIWDRAFTVYIGDSHPLIEASEKALEKALKLIKSGIKIFEISEVVEDTITKFGFNPIHNLCGHGLEQYNQHASPTIPNGKNNIQDEIRAEQVIAMEVFATNGPGIVKESSPTLIYRYKQEKPVRLWEARKILEAARTKFEGLPFAKRWLTDITTPVKIDFALKQLLEVGAIIGYPILKEVGNGLVAQTEETVIVK
ncbi:MAG: type II methionyl aminopeptidase [Methanosarcinales archaeon]